MDDDLLPQVKSYADSRDISLGRAVSELVRRGLNAPLRTRIVNGFHVADLPPDAPKVTAEHIYNLLADLE